MTEDLQDLWFPVEISTEALHTLSFCKAHGRVFRVQVLPCAVRYKYWSLKFQWRYPLFSLLFSFSVSCPTSNTCCGITTIYKYTFLLFYQLSAVRSTCPYLKSLFILYNIKLISHNIWFYYRIQNVGCFLNLLPVNPIVTLSNYLRVLVRRAIICVRCNTINTQQHSTAI